VPDTTNGDTLGEALNLCNMISKHIYLREDVLSCIIQERKNRSHSSGFDETTFV
jgi:hypothetical protein